MFLKIYAIGKAKNVFDASIREFCAFLKILLISR